MATQEIQSTDWKEFCKRFERLLGGDLVTLTTIDSGGIKRELARDFRLQSVRFDKSGDCNDRIWISLGLEGRREVTQEIIGPIHVRVREEGQNRKGLQIDAENGTSLIEFSSGKVNELLDGLV